MRQSLLAFGMFFFSRADPAQKHDDSFDPFRYTIWYSGASARTHSSWLASSRTHVRIGFCVLRPLAWEKRKEQHQWELFCSFVIYKDVRLPKRCLGISNNKEKNNSIQFNLNFRFWSGVCQINNSSVLITSLSRLPIHETPHHTAVAVSQDKFEWFLLFQTNLCIPSVESWLAMKNRSNRWRPGFICIFVRFTFGLVIPFFIDTRQIVCRLFDFFRIGSSSQIDLFLVHYPLWLTPTWNIDALMKMRTF